MFCILDPGPKRLMSLVAGDPLPFVKCLPANRRFVSALPDSEEFLVLAPRISQVILPAVDTAKLQVSHDPIPGERILENFPAILKNLAPCRNCSIPVTLSLIGACQALVRGKSRIHSRREQFDCPVEPPLRQCNLACKVVKAALIERGWQACLKKLQPM